MRNDGGKGGIKWRDGRSGRANREENGGGGCKKKVMAWRRWRIVDGGSKGVEERGMEGMEVVV